MVMSAKLFYLVGASGAGKDTLLSLFRQKYRDTLAFPVLIAHRYITRNSDITENSVSVTQAEFQLREQQQLFALSWQANGYDYGIGTEINQWLDKGVAVIVNGSREYLPEAKRRYPKQLCSIAIDVPDDILQQRLQRRDREDKQQIAARMQRHRQLRNSVVVDRTIINLDSSDSGARSLCAIVAEQNNNGLTVA